ncbi:MAG: SCP2 sterol-binding domain-containing protein [Gammaproteobacteria bacterium]|nr:SCP2 sterol-binding domain-containing protein [Gammaproteobacteria bacterium]
MKKNFFLTSLAKAINLYLHSDPASAQRLAKLATKKMRIELLPFHFIFQCEFSHDGVVLHTDEITESHAYLKGTPLQMAGMLINKKDRQHFFADDLIIEGDAELGQQVVELFDELHIDREAYLAQCLGNAPAYHAERLLKKVANWLRNTEDSITQNINEYCHEEAAWFPTSEALKDFFDEIDSLRMDVDRIEAKIKQLQCIIQSNPPDNTEDEAQ